MKAARNHSAAPPYDYIVVGAGIVGLATARELLRRKSGCSLLLLEKEKQPAMHQTGRNSGVVHAGVYYAPGSLKARLCKAGAAATLKLCEEHGIAVDNCGKLIVATSELERGRLAELEQRCRANGLNVSRLDAQQLKVAEPRIDGIAGMLVPETSIVDYTQVALALAKDVERMGGSIRFGRTVLGIREAADRVTVETSDGDVEAARLVACAGLMADRIAAMSGLADDFQIVPFRGEYYRLREEKNDIVKHLIYPVPDPALPFLGVHLTRMIGGYVTVGPNAVFSLAREGYGKFAFRARDAAQTLAFPGFWRVARANLRSGIDEMRSSLSKQRYLALCRKYCPELSIDDLQPHKSGIRAQAVMRDGTLVHDFLIRSTTRTLHVCNAPSPAATSAMPIAAYIADAVTEARATRQFMHAAAET
ncbi:L-2-hydroxyglutarate oxidase LhgO [Variovorax sp. PBS-H4]|uniref:L-2-hydroxyglutarate oxidase n=1 Tax=Variovorax sp. PBS-H4 TaxID=434008 RepID=UPI001317CCCC|nr:L-2-hydroxyglutarate oxidase [Variovorax sp. PBS-H4]VTU34296.1 L-2-hydroxyglutarate oxidase LhgO [Variovorax sp. PBS-H4]